MEGKNIKLSDVESPVTLLYFWSSTAEQKMFNITSLVPLYEEFHPKGLEIYSVCLDTDKTTWAAAVRNQKLPWVNVCDTRGVQSPYIGSYGIGALPMMWMLDGEEIDASFQARSVDEIRRYLRRKL